MNAYCVFRVENRILVLENKEKLGRENRPDHGKKVHLTGGIDDVTFILDTVVFDGL